MKMKGSKKSALKLLLIMALICLYALISLADKYPSRAADTSTETQSGPSTAPCDTTIKKTRLWGMTAQEAECRSIGCIDCHKGIEDIHNDKVNLGCIDCHGGQAAIRLPKDAQKGSEIYKETQMKAHVQPRFPQEWKSAANPERSYDLLNKESAEFIRFVNPGDLRVNAMSCGTSECHTRDVHNVAKSMMTTSAMLWGAALYNNGSFPLKNYRFGESYSSDGTPQRIVTAPQPTEKDTMQKGILPFLDPLPRWEITHMGNVLRTFERGGRKAAEIGLVNPEEPPGKPTQNLLSPRGFGTLLRTDPVFLGLQKTRLLDPSLSFLGTNDQPGDYRSSGCTACHVIYANDRDPFHSGPYAEFGHNGATQTDDLALKEVKESKEPGHPIKHRFTRAIPSSQCVVCHMHPGTNVLISYYGTTWWDLETDGDQMYPEKTIDLSPEEAREILIRNPEESSLRGKWSSVKFLKSLRDEVNPMLKHNQFADFNGHGWIYRNVFKTDRKGNYLDANGNRVEDITAEKLKMAVEGRTDDPASKGLPVHLKDIHAEKGMHCVDCHFKQDNHGDGKIYGEVRNAIEIDCVDCHGTIAKRADPTSRDARISAQLIRMQAGRQTAPDTVSEDDVAAAARSGSRMLDYRKLDSGKDRFFKDKDGQLFQRAAVTKDKDGKPLFWRVKQLADIITPGSSDYNEKAALAKTIRSDGKTWGRQPASP